MALHGEVFRAGHPAEGRSRRWLALAVLCVSLLIVTLDNTVLNVVLPTLVRDLHATTSQLQWIVDAYVMVFAGLLLVAGTAAAVALGGCLLALAALPPRPTADGDPPRGGQGHASGHGELRKGG